MLLVRLRLRSAAETVSACWRPLALSSSSYLARPSKVEVRWHHNQFVLPKLRHSACTTRAAERHAQNVWREPCKQAGLNLPQLQISCCKLAVIAGVHARKGVCIQRKVARLLQTSGFSMTDLQTLVKIGIHLGGKGQMGWGHDYGVGRERQKQRCTHGISKTSTAVVCAECIPQHM